jgi:hypothetical protein
MKAIHWVILLILVTVASYFYRVSTDQTQEPSVKNEDHPSTVTVPKIAISVEAQPSSTPVFMPKTSSQPAPVAGAKKYERFQQKPKDMVVNFEIVDGYAISFGDTILGKPLSDFHEQTGIAEIRPVQFWDHGVIPYLIKDDVVNPDRIKSAIEFFNQNTTVRFVPFENQKDAIIFAKGESNCSSFLGRTGGVQPVFLSEKCGVPEISHELMHALGFVHEQSRTDRDQFVEILWEHIEEKFQSQYAMVPEPLMEAYFDSSFDPSSIMMYDPHVFAIKPELETMKLKSGTPFAPKTHQLSASDVARITRLYPKSN